MQKMHFWFGVVRHNLHGMEAKTNCALEIPGSLV